MIIGNIDTDKEIMIVAEIGNNHEGSYTLAEELIGLAAESGVQAVKFQTFRTDLFVDPSNQPRFRRLKKFELSFNDFERLSKVAAQSGLLFLSTPLDMESARFLNDHVCAFKIASGDNNFFPLLRFVAETKKPIILSGGAADTEQLKYSRDFLYGIWDAHETQKSLAVLHCVTAYPVPPEQINLAAISHLKRELGCTVGYSDHSLGITAAVLSVALGARIVEKHFTMDKQFSDFRDHQLSADLNEMRRLVEGVRETELILGSGIKVVQESEKTVIEAVRRSVAAGRDLPKGTVIAWDDLAWTRPATGIPPGKEELVIGKEILVSLQKGKAILPEYLK